MYQALYRKWRPRTFDDVVGQAHITETLKRQVETGRLSHAYLFVGTRGTGKTTCAKILARAVNCEHPINGNPCNECASCLGISDGSILDVVELDAASNNGVDNVRALRDEAVFSPASVKKRVYIVDEVHMLSTAAFNALLKILEEPPEHLMFILATTEIHKVPATILSRCQRFSFKRILPSDVAARLCHVAEREGLSLTPDGAELLARLADGSLRDGLSLLDQCSSGGVIDAAHILSAVGLSGAAETANLLDCAARGDTPAALSILDRLYAGGKDMSAVLDELLALERDILIMKLAPKTCGGLLSGGCDTKTVSGFAKQLEAARLLSWLDTTRAALADMSKTSNRRIAAELCIMRLCSEALSPDTQQLLTRVERLENAVASGAAHRAPAPAPSVPPAPFSEPAANEVPEPAPAKAPAVEISHAPEKAAEPAESAPAAFSPSGSGWADILALIEPEIDVPPFLYLSDEANTTAVLDGAALQISMKNPFTLMACDTQEVNAALKKAAEKVAGRAVRVAFSEQSGETSAAADKLDKLAKFGNIKFE